MGSIPGWVVRKTVQMVGSRGLDHQLIPGRDTAAAHRSLGGWAKNFPSFMTVAIIGTLDYDCVLWILFLSYVLSRGVFFHLSMKFYQFFFDRTQLPTQSSLYVRPRSVNYTVNLRPTCSLFSCSVVLGHFNGPTLLWPNIN